MSYSQFALLTQQRFVSFFLVQFFGAFNDNVFKNALVILIAFKVSEQSDLLINLAFGLFILPFFLFSAFAGQVADKLEKSMLVRRIKAGEIVIMLLAVLGFYLNNIGLLLLVLFLMGAQSTLFGPVKYGYLPERLSKSELIGGNALIESSTFLAILIGTITGGLLIAYSSFLPISLAVVLLALLGFLSSLLIPKGKPADESININWNFWSATAENLKALPENRVVFLSILGISWFWFFGSVFLAQMPNFGKKTLMGNEQIVTFLLTMFSIGIGVGSLLCEKLSGKRVEIGLVPLGAIGLAVFGFDLYLSGNAWVSTGSLELTEFIKSAAGWRINMDLMLIGVFGGLYIVPLYALVQERSDQKMVSRVIAGNNIVNALFMVVAALMSILVLSYFGLSIPQLFLITIVLHIGVCVYIFTVVPEFIMRLIAWVLVSLIYRVRHQGLENIPEEGPAVLVCNHVSFVDPLIIGSRIRRPVRFVMYYKIYQVPLMKWLFKAAKTIPIAGEKENPELKEKAFLQIKEALADGDLVCIFPEGLLTPDGSIQEFKAGVERVLAESPVPVVPMALNNLWGSFFSRYNKHLINRRPRKLWAKVDFMIGSVLQSKQVDRHLLKKCVFELKERAKKTIK